MSNSTVTLKELSPVLQYCHRLSRMVSPNDAARYYGLRHDGAIADFLISLVEDIEEGKPIDFSKKKYKSVYERICEDMQVALLRD